MFAIHSLSGFTLRAPLEQLSMSSESRGLRRGDTEYEPTLVDQDEALVRYQAAATAYRSILPKALERGPVKHAWQLMSRRIVSVHPEDRIEKAWHVITESRVRQALVLTDAHGIAGLVSERDLLTSINVESGGIRDVLARRVADVMTSPVISADPVTDIRRIAQALLDYHLSGIPIVEENDKLVGFISRGDILRSVINDPPVSLWV